ncbi:MAG: radical SAM protein, partial [Candidatus Gottesmanbacteria bacterium]
VIGEGEKTFLELVNKMLKGEKCKGIFVGEPVEDLDTLPYPAYHLVDMEKYRQRRMTHYPIIGTRGCPMKCIFCSRPGMGGFGRHVRSRSAKNIIDEMETVLEEYHGRFGFQDDSFTVNRENVIEFCQEVIKRRLKISWIAGGVRIDKADEELVDLMVKAGCTGFCFGIESGSERVRNLIVHKGIWDNQIYQALRICNKYPLDIQLALIIGFPTETKDEMEKTIMFGRELIDKGIRCLEYIAIMLAVPLPGADLFTQSVKEKKMPKKIIDQYIDGKLGDGFRDKWPVYIPNGTTRDEMDEMRKRGYQAFYFTPYYLKRRIKKDITSWTRIKTDINEVLNIFTFGRSKASFS